MTLRYVALFSRLTMTLLMVSAGPSIALNQEAAHSPVAKHGVAHMEDAARTLNTAQTLTFSAQRSETVVDACNIEIASGHLRKQHEETTVSLSRPNKAALTDDDLAIRSDGAMVWAYSSGTGEYSTSIEPSLILSYIDNPVLLFAFYAHETLTFGDPVELDTITNTQPRAWRGEAGFTVTGMLESIIPIEFEVWYNQSTGLPGEIVYRTVFQHLRPEDNSLRYDQSDCQKITLFKKEVKLVISKIDFNGEIPGSRFSFIPSPGMKHVLRLSDNDKTDETAAESSSCAERHLPLDDWSYDDVQEGSLVQVSKISRSLGNVSSARLLDVDGDGIDEIVIPADAGISILRNGNVVSRVRMTGCGANQYPSSFELVRSSGESYWFVCFQKREYNNGGCGLYGVDGEELWYYYQPMFAKSLETEIAIASYKTMDGRSELVLSISTFEKPSTSNRYTTTNKKATVLIMDMDGNTTARKMIPGTVSNIIVVDEKLRSDGQRIVLLTFEKAYVLQRTEPK